MIKFLAKLLITVLIMAYLLNTADLGAITERLRSADLTLLAFAVLLLFLLVIPQSFRWKNILRVLGPGLEWRPAVEITLIGWFFNQAFPSTVGGDAFRVWYAVKYGNQTVPATYSVIFDRASALIAVMILLLLSAPLLNRVFEVSQPISGLLGFTGLLLAGCLFMLSADRTLSLVLPRFIRGHVNVLCRSARKVFLNPTGLLIITLSLSIHLTLALIVWLLARSMGIQLELVHSVLLMPVILFISTIPVSIAGWGLRESAMVFVFGMVGMAPESAIALSLTFGFAMFLTALPGGLVWWFMHKVIPGKT
jgi:uncharacterized membrane protein YbhN (UPF0104 family)